MPGLGFATHPIFAVAQVPSVFAACRNLDHALTQKPLFKALVATLPEYDELTRRLNGALADGLPEALRRRPQTMAIDLTLIPYHGQPYRDSGEIGRSKAKDGTGHFHAYASCHVIRKGHRFTVALTPVSRGEAMQEVIQRLLAQARREGVKCRLLLLDRGFCSIAVIRDLQDAGIALLMPVIHRGRKPKDRKPLTGALESHSLFAYEYRRSPGRLARRHDDHIAVGSRVDRLLDVRPRAACGLDQMACPCGPLRCDHCRNRRRGYQQRRGAGAARQAAPCAKKIVAGHRSGQGRRRCRRCGVPLCGSGLAKSGDRWVW